MYSAAHHAVFAERVKNAIREIYHLGLVESEALDLIYVNEATGGEHTDFADGAAASEAELKEAVYTLRQFKKFLEGSGGALPEESHIDRMTPFIQ